MESKMTEAQKELCKKLTKRLYSKLPKDVGTSTWNQTKLMDLIYDANGFRFHRLDIPFEYHLANEYDKTSAYPGALLNYEFPLSMELQREEIKGHGSIICAHFSYMKFKDKRFITNLYRGQSGLVHSFKDDPDYYEFYGTDIAFANFNKIYDSDIKIDEQFWFKDWGPLPDDFKEELINVCNEKAEYKKLYKGTQDNQKYEDYKVVFEAVTNGKLAQTMKFVKGLPDWYKDIARSKFTVIAAFELDYVRQEMIDTFLAHKEDALAGVVDSIFINANCKFKGKIGNNPGEFKLETPEPLRFLFAGEMTYFGINDNNDVIIRKTCAIRADMEYQGRIVNRFTYPEIDELKNGRPITVYRITRGKQISESELQPQYWNEFFHYSNIIK